MARHRFASLCFPRSPRAQAGVAYLALLIAVAIVGLAAAAALQVGSVLQRRVAEEALLDVGREFRLAFDSYARATPAGMPTTPPSLEALLRDPRYPGVRRHLRKLYADPLTGRTNWGIVKSADGQGVAGVYSLSTARPIKVGNFYAMFQDFEGKTSYADWVFAASPVEATAQRPGVAPVAISTTASATN